MQVQRLANPLVNELIIGTKDKDRWNTLEPSRRTKFLDYYENPRFALALSIVFGAPVPATPRHDLENALLKYGPNDKRFSELLRLDVNSAPGASWPNGRKPSDDVTDTAIQVVGGAAFAGAGDDVSANDKVLPNVFPFEASPWDGRGPGAPEPVTRSTADRDGDGGGARRHRRPARRRVAGLASSAAQAASPRGAVRARRRHDGRRLPSSAACSNG